MQANHANLGTSCLCQVVMWRLDYNADKVLWQQMRIPLRQHMERVYDRIMNLRRDFGPPELPTTALRRQVSVSSRFFTTGNELRLPPRRRT